MSGKVRTPPRAPSTRSIPGRVRVKLNKSSFPYKIDHYEFTIDGKVFRFEPYQILHLKYPDPSDPFVGVGFVQSIQSWIGSPPRRPSPAKCQGLGALLPRFCFP